MKTITKIYFTLFSFFKNVFWEKYVTDNDFGYRIDVFKSTVF